MWRWGHRHQIISHYGFCRTKNFAPFQVLVVHNTIHESPLQSLSGGDAVPSKGHLHGTLWRQISCHCNQGSMTKQTAVPARKGKCSGAGGNGQVTRRNQLASGSSGKSVHPRDDGLGCGGDGLHQRGTSSEQVMRRLPRRSSHFREVVPGRKDGPFGSEDYATGVAETCVRSSATRENPPPPLTPPNSSACKTRRERQMRELQGRSVTGHCALRGCIA